MHPSMAPSSLSILIAFLVFSVPASHAALTFQVYWNTALPNTPMPKAIRDHLPHHGGEHEKKMTSTSIEGGRQSGIHESSSEGGAGVIVGPGGKPIVVDKGVKSLFGHSNYLDHDKKDHVVDDSAGKHGAGMIVSPDGRLIIVEGGAKSLFGHSNYRDFDNRVDDSASVIVGPDGKPVIVDRGAKPVFGHSNYRDHDNRVDDSAREDGAGVIVGPDGKPVVVDRGAKPFFGHSNYRDHDNRVEDSARKDGAGVIVGPDGKPVIVDRGTKPLFGHSNYRDHDNRVDDSARKNGAGVIVGPDGKPVVVDRSTKPLTVHYGSAVIAGPVGKKVVVDRDTVKPSLAGHSNYRDYEKKDHVDDSGKDSGGVITGPGGKPVDVDRIDNPRAPGFFLEKDLHSGAKVNILFKRTFSGDTFLPREVADSIPFSSGELPEILSRFSVRPGSAEAESLKKTLQQCEMPPSEGEKKHCATSMESMLDFVRSSLGTRDIQTISTVEDKAAPEQPYTISSWSKVEMAGSTSAACHSWLYAYTVYLCHVIPDTQPYTVRLVGMDGTKVEAAAMCHTDTTSWHPMHPSLRAFKVKPGTATVCHFLQEGDVVWIPSGDAHGVAGRRDPAAVTVDLAGAA